MRCAVVLPAGKIASGKMVQAFAYGAQVVAIEGNFDQALEIVRDAGGAGGFCDRELDQSGSNRRTKNGRF